MLTKKLEQLYHEKEEMADKVKYLEEKLQESRSSMTNEFGETNEPIYDFDFDSNPANHSEAVRDSHLHSSEHNLLSALDVAEIFASDTNKKARQVASVRGGRSAGGTKPYGLSPQLQADTDRYHQKIKYAQDKKKLEILEQEKYELELEKRRLRAAKCGSEFTSMRIREERAQEMKKRREEKKHAKEVEKEMKFLAEKNRTLTSHMTLRNSLKSSKSWDDIQKEEEVKRRDRIEKRKQQLASIASYPSHSIIDSVDKWKTKDRKAEVPCPIALHKSHALSPSEIGAQLKRRQEQWERHLQQEKINLNAKRKNSQPVQAAIDMENRQKLYDEKKKQKQYNKAQKEAEDRQRRVVEEKRRTEKIMRSEVPESSRRLTKASEDRAKSVRSSFEKSRKQEMEEKKKDMVKRRRSKEISAFLNTLVRSKGGGMSEAERLETSRQQAAENARVYKENKKRNQERIRESLAQRPSLIERHDMTIASTAAATTALSKVATVVKPSRDASHKNILITDSWRNDLDSDELFDEDEKIQLGIRGN